MSNLSGVVADARKRIEAEDAELQVRNWFAEDRGRKPEEFYELAPMVQDMWREEYAKRGHAYARN